MISQNVSPNGLPTLSVWIIKVLMGANFHIGSLLGKTELYR